VSSLALLNKNYLIKKFSKIEKINLKFSFARKISFDFLANGG